MEITPHPLPCRRGRRRATRLVIGVGTMLVVAMLIPPSLGLQAHVVDDDAMTGSHPRGSVVFGEQVARTQLEVGDVVTFVPPGVAAEEGTVTRRVVAIDGVALGTQGDAAAAVDPWRLARAEDLERVAFSVPFVGLLAILLGELALPPWTPAGLGLALAVVLVQRRRGSRGPMIPKRVSEPPSGPYARFHDARAGG